MHYEQAQPKVLAWLIPIKEKNLNWHRKPCRYGNKITYQQKNSCEFYHNSEPVKEQRDQIKKDASLIKTKSETPKLQIKVLKITVHKQEVELERIQPDEVKSKLF